MATQTAPAAVYSALPEPRTLLPVAPRPRPRVLWPWPTFLLGAAALIAVAVGRPYWRPTPADRVQRDLADLRRIVERSPLDHGRARALGQRVLDNSHRYPQHVGEAHYLLGWLHLRKAEDSNAAEATEELKESLGHFEKAELAGVPEPDQARLAYRLGKTLHLLKAEPRVALDRLQRGDDPDNPAERWDLLAEAYLRVTPPALDQARDATQRALAIDTRTPDAKLTARSRMRLADVSLRLGQTDDAIKALERFDRETTPPDLYLQARILLARCQQAKGDFKSAVRAWEEIKNHGQFKSAERGTMFYELGLCHLKSEQPGEALQAWREAQVVGGEAGQAAAFRAAIFQIADPAKRKDALDSLQHLFDGIARPEDYRNSLISAKEAMDLLAATSRRVLGEGDFAAANRIAEVYGKVAPGGRGRELPATMAAAWGKAWLAEAERAQGPPADQARNEARLQFRRAATLYTEAATTDRPAGEQVDCLTQAVDFYFKAQDKLDVECGLNLLDRIEKLDPARAADGETAFRKALALHVLGQKEKASEEYRRIAAIPDNRHASRARYQFAQLQIEELPKDRTELDARLDLVAKELEKNASPELAEKDREVHEMSLFLLGDVVYQRRDYLKAEAHLDSALRFYPSSAQATKARYLLGRCWWFQAAKEQQILRNANLPEKDRAATMARYKSLLGKAKDPFELIESDLLARDKNGKLNDQDRVLLRQASFAVAECYFYLEDFTEAVRRYIDLRTRYERQFEELVALSQLWQCYHLYLNEPEKAAAAVASIRIVLKTLPDTAFDGLSPYHKRDFWENWINQVSQSSPGKE